MDQLHPSLSPVSLRSSGGSNQLSLPALPDTRQLQYNYNNNNSQLNAAIYVPSKKCHPPSRASSTTTSRSRSCSEQSHPMSSSENSSLPASADEARNQQEQRTNERMLMERKAKMLRIIEDSLQLKLEIKNAKEQFVELLQNFDKFENGKQPEMPGLTPVSPSKSLSVARAKVKAIYEARKQRLSSRRCVSLPQETVSKALKIRKMSMEDKENASPASLMPPPKRKPVLKPELPPRQPTKVQHKHVNCSCHPRSKLANNKLLTPIKEEGAPPPLPARLRKPLAVQSPKPIISAPLDAGDYVTLKAAQLIHGDYVELTKTLTSQYQSPNNVNNETSIWVNSQDGLDLVERDSQDSTAALSAHEYSPSPEKRRESPVKYAPSNAISELYTTKYSLKDISQISDISQNSTLREQVSGSNIDAAVLHSTFNYPLHSTLNYPLNSTISFLEDEVTPKVEASEKQEDSETTLSEPSTTLRESEKLESSLVETPIRAKDDTNVSSKNGGRVKRRTRRRVMEASRRSTISSTTSTTSSNTPKLCKEHGLHPDLGGPCIFTTDDSFLSDSDSDLERVRKSSPTETDCDSSYLSEVDSLYNKGVENDNDIYHYDNKRGQMKRQTGQIALMQTSNLRQQLGLSDSDFFDITKKNFSIDATRFSVPDLSSLSSSTSSSDEMDSTLQLTQLKGLDSSEKENQAPEPSNLIREKNTVVCVGERRPLSVATTTTSQETSPESNSGGIPHAPVNSPNVTDSTGSSSKQNTDNYDYVEVPVRKDTIKMPPPHPAQSKTPRPARRRAARSSASKARTIANHEVMSGSSSSRARRALRYNPDYDHELRSARRHRHLRSSDELGRPDVDPHFEVRDRYGHTRHVIQHSAVAKTMQRQRKKALVKKFKKFSNNFYNSTGNLQSIETLAHF